MSASAHHHAKPVGNSNSQYTEFCFTQLASVHKQNSTNMRRRRGEERVIATALTCFVSHRPLHTNEMAYPSRNTVALNSFFLPSC